MGGESADYWPEMALAGEAAADNITGMLRSVIRFTGLFLLVLSLTVVARADELLWKAGVAKTIITPAEGLWMAGYGSRTAPAQGKAMELWLKVLALEDAEARRAVIVTSDLLGFPQSIYSNLCAAVKTRFDLNPEQLMFSASHTHSGPVLRGALYDIYPLDDTQLARIEAYSARLETQVLETIEQALADLSPAQLAAGQGHTAFAVNRRNNPEGSVPQLIAEGKLQGPVDHTVPVLAVRQPDGRLKAILCGYACHNTVLSFNQWAGDYAGFAQAALEQSHPGAQAMFFMGCGGDQNPLPRRELALAERYGRMLAAAVEEVLLAPWSLLPAKLVTRMEMVPLRLGAAPTEAELETLQTDSSVFTRRWATRLLAELRAGETFIREYPFPVQVWKLGNRQWLFTLGGEPVVDYALKFKQEFGEQAWVAGYCNDVMTYLPSRRVLREDIPPLANPRWGYEGSYAFIVYGLPAHRWAEDVEDRVTDAVRGLVAQVNQAE